MESLKAHIPKQKTVEEQWNEMRHDQYLNPTNIKVWVGSPPKNEKKKKKFQYN